MLNILLGVGLLSLPYAFRQAGWAGLPILFVMGLATSYTGTSSGRGKRPFVQCDDSTLGDVHAHDHICPSHY